MTLHYTALDSSKSQIRLLTVQPGKSGRYFQFLQRRRTNQQPTGGFDDGIECSLHLASLDETNAFTALSYVWGDPSICKPIIVNGSVASVTVNLEAALRRLRQEENPQVLWVDAICINQANLDEKAAQIPFMSRIYSTAGRVVAWLGEDHECLGPTLSWMRTYVQNGTGPSSPFWPKLDSSLDRQGLAVSSEDRIHLAFLLASIGYIKFITNPYWTRIWTFAEFWLPSQEPKCVCGPYSFHASMFPDMVASEKFGDITSKTHQRFNEVELDALAKPAAFPEDITKEQKDQPLSHALASTQNWKQSADGDIRSGGANTAVNTARPLVDKRPAFALLHDDSRMRNSISYGHQRYLDRARSSGALGGMRMNRERSLPWCAGSVMLNTTGRKFTNPHDRIFGLYSLVPDLEAAFPLNYNKPVGQVVQETCAFIFNIPPGDETVMSTQNLKTFLGLMFASFPPRKGRFTDIKYASWALDLLENEYTGTPRAWMAPSLRHYHKLPYARADTGLLVLQARYFGHCQVYRRFGSCIEVEEQVSQMCRDASTDGQKVKQLRACSAYEHVEVSSLSDAELLRYFSHELSIGLPPQEQNEDQDVTFCIMLSDLEGRALIQSRGRFGVSLGHSEEQDGDVVVLCPAMAHPLVLRVGEPDPCSGDVRHKIVGIAYVEGVIEDGGLDEGLVEELLEEPLQVFHIT